LATFGRVDKWKICLKAVKVTLAAIKGERTLAELAICIRTRSPARKGQLVEAAGGVFGSCGVPTDATPAVVVKVLHAKACPRATERAREG
jgi:hypothetical protein